MKFRNIFISLLALAAFAFAAMATDYIVIETTDGQTHSFDLSTINDITFTSQPDTGGPVAYYPFNNNFNDESGNGLNGTNHGAAFTVDRHGNANSACHFTAANQTRIEVPDNDLLDMHRGDGLTVVCWVKTNAQNVAQNAWSKYNSVGAGGCEVWQTETSHLYFAGRAPGAYVYDDTSNVVVNDNLWHMIVATINGPNWSIYVDGELQRTVQGTQTPSMNNNDPFCIGSHIDVGERNSFWEGDIDDVSIYNRALTQAEIQALFDH
jgi:hypothetical protein